MHKQLSGTSKKVQTKNYNLWCNFNWNQVKKNGNPNRTAYLHMESSLPWSNIVNKSTDNKSYVFFQWNLFLYRSSNKQYNYNARPLQGRLWTVAVRALKKRKSQGFHDTADSNPQNRIENYTLSRVLRY